MRKIRGRRKKSTRSIYAHYREKLSLPELSRAEIDVAKIALEAIARAICEYVWRNKFY